MEDRERRKDPLDVVFLCMSGDDRSPFAPWTTLFLEYILLCTVLYSDQVLADREAGHNV